MKIESYKEPKSSFLSLEKDLDILVSYMLQDERLKKLLWYSTRDALKKPNLTEDETYGLLGNYIRIVPKMEVMPNVQAYVVISFDGFTTNSNNPEFRDNSIIFDIVCHYDQWQLQDFELRPYKIAAQIDTIMKNVKLTNMGKAYFAGGNQVLINSEFAGFSLMYNVIHGGEDQYGSPSGNEVDEQAFITQFNKLFNNKS